MRIAIYSHSIAPSIDGVCRRFTAILHELSRQGHQLIVFTLEDSPQDLPIGICTITLQHMYMPSYPGKKVGSPRLESFIKIWENLSKFKPDIVHITGDAFSNMFALVSNTMGIPIVGSFHTDLIDLLTTHNAFEFQKWSILLLEFVDSIVLDSCATTSKSFAKKLRNQGLPCEHIIKTSVDIHTFNPDKKNANLKLEMMFGDKDGILCVYVGRLSKEKRIDVIIDAIKPLNKLYFAIIGDGPCAEKYSFMHGKTNRVYCRPKFLNHHELAEIYASSDIHISASEFETLGNTVLEAFACGIPVIAPACQGFFDTINHADSGFLFSPGDSGDASKYLQMLLNDDNLRLQMGINAREKVRERSIDKVVDDMISWYKMGQASRRRTGAVAWLGKELLLLLLVPFASMTLIIYESMTRMLMRLWRPSS